jgi:histidyl-tRNA synthetase
MKLEMAKGMRDFSPEEKIVRQELIENLKQIFEVYGFLPLETPVIERYDILSAKFAAGEESDAMKETFKLTDQGKRQLGLRFDLTVPLARYVGMNPNIKMPFKRYQIGRVYRDGPIKLGRYREFWQCDVDIVGSKSIKSDAECLLVANDFFKKIGVKVTLKINNRKILTSLLKKIGVKNIDSVIISIDKLEKYGKREVIKELKGKGIKNSEKIVKMFDIKGDNKTKIKKLEKLNPEGLDEIKELLSYLKLKNIIFEPSLARGLTYYTSTVFEVYAKGLNFSLAAGGRYDDMIGMYLGGKREYPAVGISFGLEPILELLRKKTKFKKSVTKLYVIPIGKIDCLKIVQELRKNNIKTDYDITGRGLSKNLNYANQYEIPYVLFVGEEEIKKKRFGLKDMKSGKQKNLTIKQVVKKFI